MKNDLDQLDNTEKIIIYGAGKLGRQVYEHLRRKNMHIVAFLDKKVTGKIDGISVLSPYDKSLDLRERASAIVIICLNAGNEHKRIADDLYLNGYKKIVFLPLNYAMPYETKIRLTHLYNQALAGEVIWSEVEQYKEYLHMKWRDDAVIRENREWIWVWINQEILFSEDYFNWKGDKKKIQLTNDGVDVNLNAYYWCHELFDFIDGVKTDCQEYLSIFNIQQDTKAAIDKICDREKLVADLNQKLSYGLEFFIEAAPEVAWNSKGYFNLVGGHHRTVFLQHKGYVYYPVKMQKEDYAVWKNQNCLKQITDHIDKNNIENTYVPVPHPYFINFPHLRENWGPTILGDVLRCLGAIRLKGKKVIDISQYEGYFARVVKRMYAENVLFYCADYTILSFVSELFKLLKIEDIRTTDSLDSISGECNNADIIFGMLNTRELLKNGCLKNFKGILFTEHYLDDVHFVEVVSHETGMNRYKSIHREIFQGRMLEVGAFER